MAYTKQIWTNGDVITAEKLNHMEDGIKSGNENSGGGILVVNIIAHSQTSGSECEITPDHTYEEIDQAREDGMIIIFNTEVWSGNNPHNVYSAFVKISETPGIGYDYTAYSLSSSGGATFTIGVHTNKEWWVAFS